MPRKKSIKTAAVNFIVGLHQVDDFVGEAVKLSTARRAWLYDYSVIRAYRLFETLVLHALVGAINNDTRTLSSHVGITFPRHMTDEVCEYLVVRNGFFDFKGRDGLIADLKRFVPADHYLVTIIKDPKYRVPLDRLCALRNFAAHGSQAAKTRAKKAVGAKTLGSAGAWLMRQGRFKGIIAPLQELAQEMYNSAPY